MKPKTLDVEIIVRPIPYTGSARHLGQSCEGYGMGDNQAIAKTLRDIAYQLDPVIPQAIITADDLIPLLQATLTGDHQKALEIKRNLDAKINEASTKS